jgi:ketosteroid isomerase-like protein
MAAANVEQEIIELENEYWRAIRDRDAEAAMRLTDEVCIVTGAQGALAIEREHFKDMLASPDWTLHEFEIKDRPAVHVVGDDMAVIAYQVTEKLTVEGKPVTLKAADASTWVRKNGQWLCVLHTESLLGDPFGRDRSGATD